MDSPFSYCASIRPRAMVDKGGPQKQSFKAKITVKCEDSISNSESFSSSSIVDSEILSCNARIGRGYEVGNNMWVTIEALGVISNKDSLVNESLLDNLERRDREGLAVLKGKQKSIL